MEFFEIKELGPGPVISAIFRQLGFHNTINQMLTWDEKQCLHSPATHILAIIINILSGKMVALYKVHKFFEEKDTEIFFGKGVKPSHLNDDALARTLDKLYDANPKKVFSTLALQALMHENIDTKVLHGDTTARLLYGEYEEESDEEGLLKITWGYNKEHRTDLKQFKVGLVTTKEGFPIFGEVEAGNLDDKSWNKNLIEDLAEKITPEILKDMVYVADSALVTHANLSLIEEQKLKFISRPPSTFNLSSELIEKAFATDDWEEYYSCEKKTSYKLKELEADLFGRRYRLIVVCPLKADKRKVRGLESKIQKEKEKLEKEMEELSKIGFACEADAREAFLRFLKEKRNSIYEIKGDIELCFEKQRRNKRGRPSKDEQIQRKPVYRIKVSLEGPDEKAIEREKQRISSFVLITNIFDGYDAQSILREYKEQTVVENRFIKNPLYVGPLFVKKSQRLEALSYVVLIALLIYMIIQIRVRRALKKEKEPLELVGKVKSFEPTGTRILELFEYVKILKVNENEKIKRYLPEKYINELRRVVSFLRIDFDIFINPP